MQFAAKAVKEVKEKKSLVALLDKALSGFQPARSYKTIHASALTGATEFCPREVALLDILKKEPKPKYISTAMQVTFDQGNALHDMVRDTWLREYVVGDWKCACCNTKVAFSKAPKTKCTVCGVNDWKYHELNFISQLNMASGSLDILVDFGTGKHTVVEIKTMGKDDFKALVAPLAEHRIRTSLYLWLIKDSGRPEADRIYLDHAMVLYISKGFGSKDEATGTITPFKEFVVDYNEESIQKHINKATVVHLFRQGKTGVPAGICPTSFVNRVKSCSCVKECWSGKYPAEESK
jgi:hypothetical protein